VLLTVIIAVSTTFLGALRGLQPVVGVDLVLELGGDLPVVVEGGAVFARVGAESLDLRLKEFELLAALASAPGELKSREELAKEVWGHAGVGSSRVIDVHIRRTRAALEEKSSYEYIHTVRGLGYRFQVKPKNRTGEGADSPK
jgi:DNA-binding winged helix-turn-helix (wHTH) protein